MLFPVPHTPFLRVGPRFLSPALPHAGAPSFVPALRAGGACELEDVAKDGSLPCSPTCARTHICHHEEVRPQVFMRANEPGSPAGAAFAPVGVGRRICLCFFGCPILRVLCEGWVGLCSLGRPPHFAGPWGFFLRFNGGCKAISVPPNIEACAGARVPHPSRIVRRVGWPL